MKPSLNWLLIFIPLTLALEHAGAPAPYVFFAPQPLDLSFGRAEVGALFMAVLIGAVVSGNGRSNWYKGVQLVTVYLIIALMFYFMPDVTHSGQLFKSDLEIGLDSG